MINRRPEPGSAASDSGRLRTLLWALGVLLLLAGLQLAAPSGTSGAGPQITVVPNQPSPGQRVTVRGSGFCPSPCGPVKVAVDGSDAASNVAVAPDGTFSVEVGLTPVSGISTIVASQTTGSGAIREATAIVHIVASDQSPAPLPKATPTARPTRPPPVTESSVTPTVLPPAPTDPSPSPTTSPTASIDLSPPPSVDAGSPSPRVPTLPGAAADRQLVDIPAALILAVAVLVGLGLLLGLRAARRSRNR